ncbi:hypothetical protein JL722_10257 [Aureococcus anophagefferens]|nr:hypothetical protein JL722_10257 [Aureococcus anophagefferens]
MAADPEFDAVKLETYWRSIQNETLKALLVTSSGGVTLRTYAGLGSESDDGSDVALPAPLVATVVSQANKMRIGKLETLVSMFDKCCLVIISAPPFARDHRRVRAGRRRRDPRAQAPARERPRRGAPVPVPSVGVARFDAMFRNTFQSGFLSVLYSIGSKPLQIWDKKVRNGHIKRITDQDIQSSVLEIMGTNVSTNYITCPADAKRTLGIKLPFLVMIIKNLKKYFTFEVQVLDDKNVRRRFRASNYQSTTRVKPFICTMPMRLDEGWNQIQFNLSDFTRRAYGTNYIETLRVQIHANCRIRRIYFSDRLYSEEELPPEFKLFLPIQKEQANTGGVEPKPQG